MQVLIYCASGLKMPIYTPKWGFWGDKTSEMGQRQLLY